MEEPKPGESWKHYKGGRYLVIAIATSESTGVRHVVYRDVLNQHCWLRPLANWMDEVDLGHGRVLRFRRVQPVVAVEGRAHV